MNKKIINISLEKSFMPRRTYNLICNDAIKVLSEMPDGSIDHCITDPPYSISHYDGKKKIGWLSSNKYWFEKKKFKKIDARWDKFSNPSYEEFTDKWLSEIFRVLKPNGNILVFGSYHNIHKIGYLLQKSDKKIINSIVWYKRNAFPNITQRMLCESTEYIIWAANNSYEKAKNWIFNYADLKKIHSKICKNCNAILNFEYKYCPLCSKSDFQTREIQMRNMWDIPSTPKSEKKFGIHPSQKPESVAERLIIGFTKKNDVIIDPFMGSGTIPLIAKRLQRKFIGIDNNKDYCSIALNRINSETRHR